MARFVFDVDRLVITTDQDTVRLTVDETKRLYRFLENIGVGHLLREEQRYLPEPSNPDQLDTPQVYRTYLPDPAPGSAVAADVAVDETDDGS